MRILEAIVAISIFSLAGALPAVLQENSRKKREIRGLYSTEDDVEILTTENFKERVYNSSTAWFIEFYVSWCGDCQRFAPSWKAFASNVTKWADLVTVGVVECSLPLNTPLCRKFQVARYPTLRYFQENYQEGPDHLGSKIDESDETVEGHKKKFIGQIRKDQSKKRTSIYPDLRYYEKPKIDDIFDDATKSEFGFLIFEDENGPFAGAEIALDFHKTGQIFVKSAMKSNRQLSEALKITDKNPVVVLDVAKKTAAILPILDIAGLSEKDKIKESIRKFLDEKNIKPIEYQKPKKQPSEADLKSAEKGKKYSNAREALRGHIKKIGDTVFQVDLEAALRNSLKHEVAVTESISGEKLEALRKFVKVLEKYFPFGVEGQKFLSSLSELVSQNVSSIEGAKIADLVVQAERIGQVFSSPYQFLGCEGSSQRFRGYPCSLWKLFHFLTVNADQEHFDNEILTAMHGYIKNFFGCSGCSEHFQEMAQRRNLQGVSTADYAILWLWVAHNEVNQRLSGDTTEDPENKKYQFPSVEHCPECINYADKNFIKQEVLNYLKKMYSRYRINYLGSNTNVLFEGLNKEDSAKLP